MIPADAWPKGDRLSWADDETFTHWDFSTEPYTQTPYTAAERTAAAARNAGRLAEQNRAKLITQATAALAANRDFLATGTLGTTAVTAQVKALTRQMNAIIRLTVGALDTTDEPATRPTSGIK